VGTGHARARDLTFPRQVWRLVRRIPRGRVATYGQIAALLGRPRAARVVGRAMHDCPADVPWHRVVNASGGISRRARMEGMLTQRMLLIREGIPLRGGGVALRRYRWESAGVTERRGVAGAPRAWQREVTVGRDRGTRGWAPLRENTT
jgi:methylated-DNA-protein-cysteine methyltransferase-like protein